MATSVKVIAFTAIDPFKIEGYRDYCFDAHLDPKTPIGFARFCEAHGCDASVLLTLAVAGQFQPDEIPIAKSYGLISFPVNDVVVISGNMASWGLLFKRKPNSKITASVKPLLNSLSMYHLYE